MKQYRHKKTGEEYNGKSIVVDNKRIINPTEKMLMDAGYEAYEPVVNTYEPTEEDKARQRMAEIQAELASTDYLALKAYEGEDMSEYPDWKEKRAALREEYRELESYLQIIK